jgi:MarR-like DNA-binding transcriptional regulator SgrR of sgrS sRNA
MIIEILEKLHRNITLNQIRNFNILQQQQEYLISWRNEEFETLGRLKDSQLEIIDQMETVQGTHLKSAEQINSIYEALILLQNQTETVIVKYNNLIQYHVSEMQTQLNQLVVRQEYELDEIVRAVVSGLRKIDHNIEEMIHIQQEALKKWASAKVSILYNDMLSLFITRAIC